ncbi:MAG: type 2 isopentenyl-diphosphate Delta-isomerase [Bdellovibrionales bacterium GWB1_55_8]|nr:MAG: type 2 isopentenyl-diphosphate Delta-isomerase [Bdellovibrionales bacterium GWB1_55_8]
MDIRQFEERKQEHLRHALDSAHQTPHLSGLEKIHLYHEALPQLNLADISLETESLGQTARTPFLISAMTAGHSSAAALNQVFAETCEKRGWALGVGSQRRELESEQSGVDQWQELRSAFPNLNIYSNIGISQLPNRPISQILSLSEKLGAAAIVVHTNPLQEALQAEGTPDFRGTLEALENLCKNSQVPVILKETGCGFSQNTLKRLTRVKLGALDVAGLGGTHWGRLEGARAPVHSVHSRAASAFASWGETTVDSVISARKIFSGQAPSNEMEIWASGGLRTGVDAAKLIALGAIRIGFAQPALQAALEGADSLDAWMETREYELRVALFCTGCKNPNELRIRQPVTRIVPTDKRAAELEY